MAVYTPRINGRSIVSMAYAAMQADEAKATRRAPKLAAAAEAVRKVPAPEPAVKKAAPAKRAAPAKKRPAAKKAKRKA